MNKKNLLIEIYTEELPIKCISEFDLQIPLVLKEVLDTNNIEYKSFETYITSVRLIFYIKEVSETSKKFIEEIIGPPLNIAVKDNRYTEAAFGFLKKYELELKDLYVKNTEKGNFIAAKKVYGGQSIVELLPNILLDILKKLNYPKQMIWDNTKFKFPRPIRNLLVIFGDKFLKIKFLNLQTSNYTYGIKTYPLKKIKINFFKKLTLAESYFEILKNECIIFDPKERLRTLNIMLENLIKSASNFVKDRNLLYDKDENLFNEIISIVEYPTCILCEFPKEFLDLPKEFIIICMKTKQKFIPVYDENGDLVNFFIGVKNGFSEYLDNVKIGYQKVLISRLNDVKYYYQTDIKVDFHSRFEKLKGIIYNTEINSSYYDKVLRIKNIAYFLNKILNFNIDDNIINITSELIKNDLTTQIVYEYPELQGIAGEIYCKYYCQQHNLSLDIALCCQQHYQPRSYEDSLPNNNLSILFSLANKISDVIDISMINKLPTGSSDIYGIKKTGDSLIKICMVLKLDLDFNKIVNFYLTDKSFLNLTNINFDIEKIVELVVKFFSQRFENILLNQGYNIDDIRAVLFNFNGEFYTKFLIINCIKNFRLNKDFLKVVEIYKRINNILLQAKNKEYDFEKDSEIEKKFIKLFEEEVLYNKLLDLKKEVDSLYHEKNFTKIMELFLDLKNTLDNFFDKVLIFDQNKEIALNRLKMLNHLLNIFKKLAIFSQIQL